MDKAIDEANPLLRGSAPFKSANRQDNKTAVGGASEDRRTDASTIDGFGYFVD